MMNTKKRWVRIAAAALAAAMLTTPQAQAATQYRTLEFGSRGTNVLQLQRALLTLGFDPNGTDGKFGRGTEKAVIAYQESRGLEADGKAGTLTLTMLYSEADGSGTSGTASSSGTAITVPATTNPNTLKFGDSGSRVTEMQTALKTLGYYSGTVDGKFGSGTHTAVVSFQRASGLTADGLAGTRTLELLYEKAGSASAGSGSSGSSSSSGSDFSSLTRTLRRGYTGADVKIVQTRLRELGYYTGVIDGEYGSGSIAAVKSFQSRNGLKADGLAGNGTFKKLFDSSAVAAGTSTSSGSASSSSSTSSGSSAAEEAAPTKLQSGDSGDAVKQMQKALQKLDYNISADGVYGPMTINAVKAFQRINGLEADGVAGAKTLELLYSGNAKAYEADENSTPSSSNPSDFGSIQGPNSSQVQLLHWFNEVKPKLKTGQTMEAYDPDTGISWTLYVMSRGNHADVEPLTAADTEAMFAAFGGKESWGPKVVYVKLPDGRWSIASTHNVAHGSQTIKDNNFDGQNCVHFLRDMDECSQNDPNYGVQNQNAIRKAWKELTGIAVGD